jgi:CBS domain-containing protein
MTQRRVADVMTGDVVAVRGDTPCGVVLDLLVEHRVSGVPVVDSVGHVEGVVSESDLLSRFEPDGRRRRFAMHRHSRTRAGTAGRTAADVMTSPAVMTLATVPVDAAARRMLGAGVKRLPVEDDLGRLVGIVTRGDLLKAYGGHIGAEAETR